MTSFVFLQELTSPRLIKSHLPYRFLPTAMHNGEAKVSPLRLDTAYPVAMTLRCMNMQSMSPWNPVMVHFQVIYMARNPKDLVVSYYQFHRSLRTMSYRGTFQEFSRRFMNDKCNWPSDWFPVSASFFLCPVFSRAPSCISLPLSRSGIWFLVWTCSGILGTPHGLKCALLEIWRYVQGNNITTSLSLILV